MLHSRKVFCFLFLLLLLQRKGKVQFSSLSIPRPYQFMSLKCDHMSLSNPTGSQFSTVCVLFLHAPPDGPCRSYFPVTGQLSEYLSITFCPYVSFKETLSQSCSRRERGRRKQKEEMLSFFPQRTHPNLHFPDRKCPAKVSTLGQCMHLLLQVKKGYISIMLSTQNAKNLGFFCMYLSKCLTSDNFLKSP